jgi:hypothetical protein
MPANQQLLALYHRNVGMGFDRQMRLAEFLEERAGGAGWGYTISAATLTFGTRVQFEAHDLGSHADPDNSWLWAWGNPHLKLTPANRALAEAVRDLGRRAGVPEFLAERPFELEPILGEELSEHAAHVFGIILGGELEYDACYTIPFEHGRSTTLIRDDRLRFTEELPLNRIAMVFPRVVSALPVFDHRAALIGYMQAFGLTPSVKAEQAWVTDSIGNQLTAKFDSLGRVAELKCAMGPTK